MYTEPQPLPVVMYVVPGLYGARTCALLGTALKPHNGAADDPCGDTQTVRELGLIAPVHGYGVSVARTMVVSDTWTTSGFERV